MNLVMLLVLHLEALRSLTASRHECEGWDEPELHVLVPDDSDLAGCRCAADPRHHGHRRVLEVLVFLH